MINQKIIRHTENFWGSGSYSKTVRPNSFSIYRWMHEQLPVNIVTNGGLFLHTSHVIAYPPSPIDSTNSMLFVQDRVFVYSFFKSVSPKMAM